MAKRNLPSVRERREARKIQQIDTLLALDMEPEARTDEEKAVLVAELLDFWENPPHQDTLSNWRGDPLYAQRRDAILGDETLVERLQYWSQITYIEDILPKYKDILKSPEKHQSLWWKVSERIRDMAGLAQPKQEVSITVLAFLKEHGIGDEIPPRPMITVERAEDGTVIDAEFRALPAPE